MALKSDGMGLYLTFVHFSQNFEPLLRKSIFILTQSFSRLMRLQPGATVANDELWKKFNSILNSGAAKKTAPADVKWSKFKEEGHLSLDDLFNISDQTNGEGIVVLDYRERALFLEDHITLFDNVVNIDPSFVRVGYSLEDLCLHTMALSTPRERDMVRNVSTWELVVVVTGNGEMLPRNRVLLDILKAENTKPVVLDGGFAEWEMFIHGKKSVPSAAISVPTSVLPPQPTETSKETSTPKFVVCDSLSTPSKAPAPPEKRVLQPAIRCGLINLGNTCYMNAALQCLVNVDVFSEYILHLDVKNPARAILTIEYKKLLEKMVSGTTARTVVNPRSFKNVLASLNDQFKGYTQQDSSEFLHFVLDTIHEELNLARGIPPPPPLTQQQELEQEKMPLQQAAASAWYAYSKSNKSFIMDTFCGQYSSKLQCWKCHLTSTTFIPFTMLSLPIPKMEKDVIVDVYDCLDSFTKPEKLMGDNSWRCPRCGEQKASLKKLSITKVPKVLIIHLERFKYSTRGGGTFEKDKTLVQFDSHLEMGGYLTSDSGGKQLYKLRSFVSHYGTLTSGHYKAAIGDIVFDDDKVLHSGAGPLREGAFVVFYERIA